LGKRKGSKMSNKYFNTSKYKRDEERKEKLMTAFVYSVLGFAFIGVMFTFSFTINTVWELIK
jgi:hypothetical protein